MLAYFWGEQAPYAFRRGWTHGILALVLWPWLLTGTIILLDRVIRRLRRASPAPAVAPRQVLLLSSIAIVSHPILDTLNTYGVRWLMPFSERWFYGDTLFIVDPWLWLTLCLAVLLSRPSRGSVRPARIGLGIAAGYAAIMATSGIAAREIAARELATITGEPARRLMVSPLPVTPLQKRVVVEQESVYRTADFRWAESSHIDRSSVRTFPKGPRDHPAVQAAAVTLPGRQFLLWARFPAYRVEPAADGTFIVHIVDLRYAERPANGFGSVSIPVAVSPADLPSHSDVIE